MSKETIVQIKARVSNYPWHEMPDDGGWGYGVNIDYLNELCTYWVDEYDWVKHEREINQFTHFKVPVDGIEMHYIHEKGSGDNNTPLLIIHGWPGTVVELLDVIDMLPHPQKFGGDVNDAFDVVAPSLPGFGFSGRPPRPFGPRKMASILNALMGMFGIRCFVCLWHWDSVSYLASRLASIWASQGFLNRSSIL